MKILYKLIGITAICIFLCFYSKAQIINPLKSEVSFKVSNMLFKTVKGNFTGMQGEIYFNVNDLDNAYFNVCIDAASINTSNEKRDEHLRSEDFLGTENHLNICFASSVILFKNDKYLAIGQLTMHGVTQRVEIPFTSIDQSFQGNLSVNRLDYNIGESTGKFLVGNTIKISIVCVLEN